jgi:hypothetical protein
MNEHDAMTLLRDANPVRPKGLGEPPVDLLESILARPERRSGQLLLAAAAVAVVALAASLIGVFLFGGGSGKQSMHPGIGPIGSGENLGVGALLQSEVKPWSIDVADVSLFLGTPVALPTTAVVQPADAQSASAQGPCPTISVEGIDGTCTVTVRFPSQSLSVEYWQPPGQPNSKAGFEETVRTAKAEITRRPGSGKAELLDLNGTPARFFTGVYAMGSEGSASIDFLVGETRVTIYGDQSEETLEALARSVLDQMPPPGHVALADASTVLGAPIALPNTSLVQPSDAAQSASAACPSQPTTETPCQVTVDFPSLTVNYVPLTIRYLRPAATDPVSSYRSLIKQDKDAKIVDLNGTPALFVQGLPTMPSWIEFVSGGTDVTVQGPYGEAALQDVAQSIVNG